MKKLNNQGFALLETIIVSVFIIGIFTFVYVAVVPLLGKYEDLSRNYNVLTAYQLYHIRDAMYKDKNFNNIVKNSYKNLTSSDFDDSSYYNSLTNKLFGDEDFQIIYIRKLKTRADAAISSLNITGEFADYIKKISDSKTDGVYQNFIFLETNNNYAYLGLAVDLNDLTNYEEPVTVDDNTHKDNSGANAPLLMDGMIPVYYNSDENNWYKADSSNKSVTYAWYNYNDLKWANVVLVKSDVRNKYKDADKGTLIDFNDIIAFYVWIPRFEYNIASTYGIGGTLALPGEISVNFVNKSVAKTRTISDKTWRTATAFSFGKDELDGFWFAKFEMSNSELRGFSYEGHSIPYILPEVFSWTGQKIASIYSTITTYMNGINGSTLYGLIDSSEIYTSDVHVMKNDEWGAVAYLSQSKYGKYANTNYVGANKEVYINNRQNSSSDISVTTGSSAGVPSSLSAPVTKECATNASNTSIGCYKYYVEGVGTGASTTGTIYGVYDMSGGVNEIIMGAAGNVTSSCGGLAYAGTYTDFTGFKGPFSMRSSCNDDAGAIDFPSDSKYYHIYADGLKYGCDTDGFFTLSKDTCYSHAMSETGGWYNNVASGVGKNSPWYLRGGRVETSSGIFAISSFNGSTGEGGVSTDYTSRPIIAVYK